MSEKEIFLEDIIDRILNGKNVRTVAGFEFDQAPADF